MVTVSRPKSRFQEFKEGMKDSWPALGYAAVCAILAALVLTYYGHTALRVIAYSGAVFLAGYVFKQTLLVERRR